MWPHPFHFDEAGVFDCRPVVDWTTDNTFVTPLAAATGYLLMVFTAGSAMEAVGRTLGRSVVKHLSALWNLGLCIFSIVGVASAVPYTVDLLAGKGKGLRYALCSDDMMMGPAEEFGSPGAWSNASASKGLAFGAACYGQVGLMMTLFMLSKFPELADTVFLMLKGKPVGTLQWWHHASVLFISWYAFVIAAPSSVMFATMNYTVHSIMYGYFCVSTYTRALGFMRMPITLLQLAQMVVGLFLVTRAWVFQHYEGGCATAYQHGYFVAMYVMYGSYFILFAHFFYQSYVANAAKSKKH